MAVLAAGGLTVAVSEHDSPPEATEERLRQHLRVNLALLGVPFRYGQQAANVEALRAGLMGSSFEDQLARLAGCVELSLPVEPGESESTSSNSGAAYLRRKQQAYRTVEDIKRKLASQVRDFREQRGRLTCLVEYSKVNAFRAALAPLTASGPWPPSSFL